MGAWGHHPQDNDTAADFCFKLENMTIREWVLEGIKSKSYDENRIAAWMLRQVGFNYVWQGGLSHACGLAIARLQVMLDDQEWIDTWSNGEAVVADILATQKELKTRFSA